MIFLFLPSSFQLTLFLARDFSVVIFVCISLSPHCSDGLEDDAGFWNIDASIVRPLMYLSAELHKRAGFQLQKDALAVKKWRRKRKKRSGGTPQRSAGAPRLPAGVQAQADFHRRQCYARMIQAGTPAGARSDRALRLQALAVTWRLRMLVLCDPAKLGIQHSVTD